MTMTTRTAQAYRLIPDLSLPMCDALMLIADQTTPRVLPVKRPAAATLKALIRRGLLEQVDSFERAAQRLTALGYTVCHELGLLGGFASYADYLTLTAEPLPEMGDTALLQIKDRVVEAEISRRVGTTLYTFELSTLTGEWREFARGTGQVIRIVKFGTARRAPVVARGIGAVVQTAAAAL